MTRLLALALLLLPACDPTPAAVEDDLEWTTARVRIVGPLNRGEHGREVIETAGEILGIKLVVVEREDPTYGALAISIFPGSEDAAGLLGETHHTGGPNPICYRTSWCYDDLVVCAHEIGHMLGLEESTSGGLMDSPSVVKGGPLTLTTEERGEMTHRAEQLARCKP